MTKTRPCYIIELTRDRTMLSKDGIPMYRRDGHPTPYPAQAFPYPTLKEAQDNMPKKFFPNARIWLWEDGVLKEPK